MKKVLDKTACFALGLIAYGITLIAISAIEGAEAVRQTHAYILYTMGVAYMVGGFFIGSTIQKSLQINLLLGRICEFNNIRYYYSHNLLLALVEERLTEVATNWQNSLRLLGREKMCRAEAQCKSDYTKQREHEQELEEMVKRYQQSFDSIYDHAKKVFGESLELKEKQIELYAKQTLAA